MDRIWSVVTQGRWYCLPGARTRPAGLSLRSRGLGMLSTAHATFYGCRWGASSVWGGSLVGRCHELDLPAVQRQRGPPQPHPSRDQVHPSHLGPVETENTRTLVSITQGGWASESAAAPCRGKWMLPCSGTSDFSRRVGTLAFCGRGAGEG